MEKITFASLILVVITTTAAPAMDLTPYAGPEAPLCADGVTALADWHRDQLLATWRARGRHDEKWDEELTAVLEAVVTLKADPLTGAVDREAMRKQAKRLRKRPMKCNEPLAAYAGFILTSEDEFRKRSSIANKVLDYSIRRHPAWIYHPLYAAEVEHHYWLSHMYGHRLDKPLKKGLRQATETLARRLTELCAHDCTGGEAAVFSFLNDIETYHPEVGTMFGEAMRAGADQLPAERAWFADALRGYAHYFEAWGHRGNGWAGGVSDERWKLFRDHLDSAYTHLQASWQREQRFAHVAHRLQTIATLTETPHPSQHWFEQAIRTTFDFRPAYSSRLHFLRPRWGGSYQEMLAFGRDCAATARFDTEVPWYLVAACDKVASDARQMDCREKADQALATPWLADALRACLDGYRARHADDTARHDRYDCILAAVLIRGGATDKGVAILRRLGPERWNDAVEKIYDLDFAKVVAAAPATKVVP